MIDGLKPYPKYKDSGVPWLGEVPEHWEVQRLKYLFREVDERSETGDEELLSVSHLTGVTPRREKNVTMFLAESNVGHKLCAPGDVVVNTMWAWMAALGVSRQHGMVSPSYAVYRPRHDRKLSPTFVDRLLRTEALRAEYVRRSTGVNSSRMRLYPEQFLTVRIPFPSIDEQEAIGRFLAHVDRQIARYIRAKKNLIALLNEQKQATIHQAVTRGLDPNVRFKASGVEWLGDVPEHWTVKRLKWVTRLQRGYDLPKENRMRGPYPVVSSGGIIDSHVEARSRGPGVVMGRYGSTDAVFYIESDFWPHNTALFVTDFHDNDPQWCYRMLCSISKADHSGKSAVPGVDRKDLFEIPVAVPPLSEQKIIRTWLAEALTDLAEAVVSAERQIALARELRTRLGSDITTGKVDVRDAAAHLPLVEDTDELPEIGDTEEETGDESDAQMKMAEIEE